MKRQLTLLLFFPLVTFSQITDSAWIINNYTKKEYYIRMRDGVKLYTAVYAPKSLEEKHPIIIVRTPYSAGPYGEKNFDPKFWNGPRNYFFGENYIYVVQDIRGRWKSEGEFIEVRPYIANKKETQTDEASDAYDTIDWLVKNISDNNGNVGVYGTSYPGYYANMAARSHHPALKAVSPQAPVTDWYMGDDFHHNGALMLNDAFKKYAPKNNIIRQYGFNFPTHDHFDFYLRTGAIPNFNHLLGDTIQFWNDLILHPDYDDYWQSRNGLNNVQDNDSSVATLIVGGTYDAEDCYGALNLYKSISLKVKNKNRLVMGPWSHGQWGGFDGSSLGNIQWGSNTCDWYRKNIELPFFNYYLKNKGNGGKIKTATIFFSGDNSWKQFETWPPVNILMTKYALTKNGLIKKLTNQSVVETYDEYVSDPSKPVPYINEIRSGRGPEYMTDDQRFAGRRTDVLAYQTPILNDDLTLAGPINIDLMVAISGTDADFIVKVIDVFSDDFEYPHGPDYIMNGYEMLIRGDVMRGKYRNSFEKPEAFIPGKPSQVKFTLNDVAHTFKKGHRLMVQIQSSWFPLVDRNPQQFMNIYNAKNEDYQKETIKIFHNSSILELPVLK